MPHMAGAIIAKLRRLATRCDGSVAIIFGLAVIPIVIAAGMAVDIGRAYFVKVRLGAALDAAALAVGSETNRTQTQLTSDLQNYFTANYPSTAIGTSVTVSPVPATADLTASVVNFQAQATVPMTFMQLVGFNSITVTVTAQTKKTSGLEVALVLDNTGSMLCGPNDGAPYYSDSSCRGSVVSTDTTCANSGNQSRICTLINAATQFVNTLTSAISSSQQLYITVVPYVTTVNVGSSFCTSATNCTHIATDCASNFSDYKGNAIGVSNPITITGNTSSVSNQNIITNISPNTTGLTVGTSISVSGILPSGTTITSVDSPTQLHVSNNALSTRTGATITVNITGTVSSGSQIITNINPSATIFLPAGTLIMAGSTGFSANSSVQSADSATQIHTCNSASSSSSNVTLTRGAAITYDTTNTNTTQNWMGCVIEPTSSDENSVSGVINSSTTDPDYTEPSSWPNWYPFWWASDSGNNWAANGIQAQSTATETQGSVVSDWLQQYGPNQGCPVPMLPLTDVTTTTGKTQVLNTISSMWPRDAGGTQVHIGMIWGWRALSPNGPFTPNNSHPLSYNTAATTGWKKAIVLMTDGTEEWPSTDNLTGLGQIADGKIGTTNTSTAVSNLNTRLANVCSNLAANGNYVIYTIGLGTDGASNTQLQNCATTSNGGFFEAATPSNLQQVFNDIARSLIALRLTQ
jgi:Flp pilus assembly protein TadG